MEYIYLRHAHWLSIGMQIRAHHHALGAPAMLLCAPPMARTLEQIGLRPGADFLTLEGFATEMRAAPPAALRLTLHHHKASLEDWARLAPLLPAGAGITLSFFVDGYSNLTMHHREVSAFLAENPGIARGVMLYFDLIPQDSAWYGVGFQLVKIASANIRAMAELPYFLAASEAATARCLADAQGRPILLVMLRPWGSASFHGGQLRLEEPAERLVELVLALSEAIAVDLGEEPHLVLRPDGRDAALMAAFTERFPTPATDMTGLWPAQLSMDPFLYNFPAMSGGAALLVAALDSTASLPFLRLGLGQRHYFGAPLGLTEALFSETPTAMPRLRDKLTTLERHARAIAEERPIEITPMDPLMFCAKPA